jgi:membrane protease YdiL (CAAX protease family)
MGLIFGAIYLRTQRLAPLIVAHVLIDITAFVGYPLALILFPGVFA